MKIEMLPIPTVVYISMWKLKRMKKKGNKTSPKVYNSSITKSKDTKNG
jgi:hypothetical protein